MTASLEALVVQVSHAVKDLRQTLESNEVETLEAILAQTTQALEAINGYAGGLPEGGPERLKHDIIALEKGESDRLMGILNQASVDHQVNGALIKLALQRSAALQSFVAQQSPGATYEIGGAILESSGRVFSKKA